MDNTAQHANEIKQAIEFYKQCLMETWIQFKEPFRRITREELCAALEMKEYDIEVADMYDLLPPVTRDTECPEVKRSLEFIRYLQSHRCA